MEHPEYLIAAKDMLTNAKYNLCMAVSAFEKTGADFGKTIKELKEVIGDLECAIVTLDGSDSQKHL